ncbi:hypothetical protein P691DRAFT_725446 [Macrolepiota fuliginosa MF-IS2]|uniref:Membrane insertase YidC/Oxa/ALB C-terminal domain-containing protein n=1 Tax=Macrolepiota fuliginosa MF-IS2 TaxID=1400762 RepID=A0A9P5XJL3_9AGAR|nr:hypothetical protein P691DRAFT_725446 [Macrolepiota fuliginosa MF-IS2]
MASFGGTVRLLGRSHLTSGRGIPSRLVSSALSRSADSTLRRGFASVRQQNVLGLSHSTSRSLLQPNHLLPGLVFTRHFSKDSPVPVTEAATSAPSEAAAAVSAPLPPTETASTVAETASSTLDAIHTPLQYGDFSALGLSHWTPSGIVQWTMEIINTTTHLPWFWTIVAGTVFWRLLVLPVSINGLRNSSRLQPYQNEIQKVQAEMGEAAKKNDLILRQKTALKLKAVYEKAGVSVMGGVLVPIVQIPVTLGMFFGVRNMCNLPVEQMKWSGLELLPDLTVPDPTWILPIAMVALVNVQIPLGAAEMDYKTRPGMAHLMNALRVLSVLAIGVTASFPAGLVLSLITTSAFTILQSAALQYGPIRRYLGIQDLPQNSKLPSMKESLEYIIKSLKDKVQETKEVEARKVSRARASEQMKKFEQARRK